MDEGELERILDRHRDRLMAVAGVEAIGIGLSPAEPGVPRILVYASHELRPDFPTEIEGAPITVIRLAGHFRPL